MSWRRHTRTYTFHYLNDSILLAFKQGLIDVYRKSVNLYQGWSKHHDVSTQCDIVTSIIVHTDAIFPA
ncbi:hypothetical protein SeKA_B0046 (plasmid) [Salmonella enterica subsp. enterica serovar Kentucky str. CVM29188]|nr:hypothetical protein SeKA_B0046 [Salmonella enterica subsp. enterica serovar Kentucky str. CVM29188]